MKTYSAIVEKTMVTQFEFTEDDLEGEDPQYAAVELSASIPECDWEEDRCDVMVSEVTG
jgi:hypothetical protein